MRTTCRAPASSTTLLARSFRAASSAIACSATTRWVVALGPLAVVRVSMPGRPFMRPTRIASLSSTAASLPSSSGSWWSIAVWTASPSSITALASTCSSPNGADPSRRRGMARLAMVATRSASRRAGAHRVRCG